MVLIYDIKALINDYVERVWNQGDLMALESLTTANYTYQIGGQPARDRAAMGQFITLTHTAFPGWRVEIVEMIAEQNKAAIRWQGQVIHAGVFNGIQPTGKQVMVIGINIYHLVDGLIAAEWEQTDTIGMLQQMGVLRGSGL